MMANWKDFAGRGPGLILRYYPRIRLEWLRKTTKNLKQDGRSREWNPGPPKYEAGVLTNRPQRSMQSAGGNMCIHDGEETGGLEKL
jgi:hypothetical protein